MPQDHFEKRTSAVVKMCDFSLFHTNRESEESLTLMRRTVFFLQTHAQQRILDTYLVLIITNQKLFPNSERVWLFFLMHKSRLLCPFCVCVCRCNGYSKLHNEEARLLSFLGYYVFLLVFQRYCLDLY